MRTLKQPIFAPVIKQQSQQSSTLQLKNNHATFNAIQTVRQVRSASRNKNKLKYHLFKNMNQITQEKFYSPSTHDRVELDKCFSAYSPRSSNAMAQTKSNIRLNFRGKDERVFAPKKLLKQKVLMEANTLNEKRQKKQFKLIHQIKKQKQQAKRANYKIIQTPQKSNLNPLKLKQIDLIVDLPLQSQEFFMQQSLEQECKQQVKQQHSTFETDYAIKGEIVANQESIIKQAAPQAKKSQVERENQLVKKFEQSFHEPDLSRSFHKAQLLLKKRKSSSSSIDIDLRKSKVREEMSLSLALQSRDGSKMDISMYFRELLVQNPIKKVTTLDKIHLHIQILQFLSHFVFESTKFDTITEEWEELNFLIYKKYYIQRVKIVKFIKKYPMKNPFLIYNADISSKEIIHFMKSEEGCRFKNQIAKQTEEIKQKLSSFYSHFDKSKVGEKINMFEYDNFSHWIIEQLWAELILTEYNTNHPRDVINLRLCRILQLIFLISELNGRYECSVEQAETAIRKKQYGNYLKEGKDIFQKYILYKSP